ncbi:uncharacterized protein BJX67DRAFT_95584 [Aspergillus lucknowensis]|uniref:Ubiquitin-like domain-containing protein n=1 Tax=Aspergillus lucknowensis TaxID=176173 RepID=A0ABR4M5Y8_9EURO
MGCCFSLSRDTHSHYAPPTPTEDQQSARSAPPHASSHPSRNPSSLPSHPRHHLRPPIIHPSASSPSRTPVPLTEHINAPIRPHVWHSKRRRWTRSLLDQERKEFFETRVTGRPEVWAALAAALSFMRADDLATAQSIIDAAGLTVPTGDLCQGCYDEQGVLYRLPRCIVSDPENMVVSSGASDDDEEEEVTSDEDGGRDVDVDVGFEGTDDRKFAQDEASGDELIGDEDGHVERQRERRRDEKGKTSERDLVRVKARLSDRDGGDVVVSVRKTQNVGVIARKIQQEVGIPRTQRVRIAYLGKMLKENTPLTEQGWKPGHVINALVVVRRPSSSRASSA